MSGQRGDGDRQECGFVVVATEVYVWGGTDQNPRHLYWGPPWFQ